MAKGFVEGRGSVPVSRMIAFDTGEVVDTFFVCGPFPEGVCVRELWFWASNRDLTGELRLSWVWVASSAETVENFRAGRPVLERGAFRLHGQPALRRRWNTRVAWWMALPMAFEVRSGPVWLLMAVQTTGIEQTNGVLAVGTCWPGWFGGYRVTPAEVKVVENLE